MRRSDVDDDDATGNAYSDGVQDVERANDTTHINFLPFIELHITFIDLLVILIAFSLYIGMLSRVHMRDAWVHCVRTYGFVFRNVCLESTHLDKLATLHS